jgi:hypothetical protein
MTQCKKGLHDLDDPSNVGVQRSTGRQFCKVCKREYRMARRREQKPPSTLCRKGLHDLADEANVYVRPDTGRRECRACKAIATDRRRAAARAAATEGQGEERAKRAPLVPPAGVWAPRVGVGGRDAAAYRLARMVRAGRGL